MRVKVPPCRRHSDSLSDHSDRTRFSEAEAGTRAESEVKQISHTAANGEVAGENKL